MGPNRSMHDVGPHHPRHEHTGHTPNSVPHGDPYQQASSYPQTINTASSLSTLSSAAHAPPVLSWDHISPASYHHHRYQIRSPAVAHTYDVSATLSDRPAQQSLDNQTLNGSRAEPYQTSAPATSNALGKRKARAQSGSRSASKDKQRRPNQQTPQPLAQPESQKRPCRCLNCNHHSSKTSCFGYPLCKRCRDGLSVVALSGPLLDGDFLDWRSWAEMCHALRATASAYEDIGDAGAGAGADLPIDHQDYAGSIILEFLFYDRIQREQSMPHVVVFEPREQQWEYDGLDGNDMSSHRPPAIYLQQLDDVVSQEVWGPCLWSSNRPNFGAEEIALWKTIRLFTGYMSMLHNLARTEIQCKDYTSTKICRRLAAELIYALGFRVALLYREISMIYQRMLESEELGGMPVASLYGLEILCRLLQSMKSTEWGLSELPPFHPLLLLQTYLNARVQHIIQLILAFECKFSGEYNKNHFTRPVPAMIEFSRSQEERGFPSHCSIMAARHDPISHHVPCAWSMSSRQGVIDILTCAEENLLTFSQPASIQRMPFPAHLVADDNRIVEFNPLSLAHRRAGPSSVNTGTDGFNNSGRADSYVTDLTSRIQTLHSDYAVSERYFEHALPQDEIPDSATTISSIMDLSRIAASPSDAASTPGPTTSSALPSLVNSSPASVFSPVTPHETAGMGHWHDELVL